MKNDTYYFANEIKQTVEDARATFGSLSDEQINWKPAAESWSVAQCLDHLIRSNDEMKPVFKAKLGGAKNSFWESWSPLTGFFGGMLKSSLRSDKKKFKAPSDAIVPPSDVPAGIVDRFAESQEWVIAEIEKTAGLNWDKTVVTSPFMGLITYRLRDALDIIVEHSKRHLRQAKRVTELPSFPQ
ncbi:MAG: DinB family protein [Acidobacteria bacterium]|nr:DinB family protein [Acidobacteriota bacterium]